MPRFALLLLTLAAIAGGGANLYLGGIEATRDAEAQLDARLGRAADSVRALLSGDPAAEQKPGEAGKDGAGEAAAVVNVKASQTSFDDALAKRLATLVDADVTLIRGGKVEASSLPASERARLASASGAASEPSFGLGELPLEDFSLLGVPLPLLAPHSPATRARRLPLPGIDKAEAIVSVSAVQALIPAVNAQKRSLVITGAIAVLGLALLALRRKDGVPGVGAIADVAERGADGDVTAHAAEYLPGELGRLARAVNRLISRSKQNNASHSLSSQFALPSRQTEAPDDIADAFPFGSVPAGTSAPHGLGPTPGPTAAIEFSANPLGSTPGPFSTDFDPSRRSPGPGAEVDPFELARGETPPPPPPPSSPWESVPSDPVPPPSSLAWDQPTRPLVPQAGSGPISGPIEAATADAYGKAIAEAMGAGGHNPDATVVAAIPEALLRATTRSPASAPKADADSDEAAFHQVYEDFLRIREECGEPTAGLSYEKFAMKLRSNRAQLMEKYQCRTVRFTAYVKAGKAALKASPIKD